MDDREPYGRIAWDAYQDWLAEQFRPWPMNKRVAWEEADDGYREAYMRAGSAVAARAVADAGGEAATARTDRDRMRMQQGALASHLPAALEALSAAVADARYEHRRRRYEAARTAFEALRAGEEADGG